MNSVMHVWLRSLRYNNRKKSQNLCKSKCIFAVEAKTCNHMCLSESDSTIEYTHVHVEENYFFKVRKLWRVYAWWNITLEL